MREALSTLAMSIALGAGLGACDKVLGIEELSREGAVFVDSGGTIDPFFCNDDSDFEPNDSSGIATPTGVGNQLPDVSLLELAICPSTDVDFFQFAVPVSQVVDVTASIDFAASDGDLELDLLFVDGTPIVSGIIVGPDPGFKEANVSGLETGTYFVRVRSTDGSENNYTINIRLDF